MADHVEAVTVEQCDREAAADLADKLEFELAIGGNDLAAIRNGTWDNVASDLGTIVQAFARHRTQANETAREALDNIRALATKRQNVCGPDGCLADIHGFATAALARIDAALSGDATRTQANEAMREALERIAATDFDSPPWQAVEAEIKQIALSALSGDSA